MIYFQNYLKPHIYVVFNLKFEHKLSVIKCVNSLIRSKQCNKNFWLLTHLPPFKYVKNIFNLRKWFLEFGSAVWLSDAVHTQSHCLLETLFLVSYRQQNCFLFLISNGIFYLEISEQKVRKTVNYIPGLACRVNEF